MLVGLIIADSDIEVGNEVRRLRRLDAPATTLAVLSNLLHPRRSGDANVLGDNDRAHLHGNANDPRGNDRTLNPGCNHNRDDDGRNEERNPGLGGSLTT
jgi:hypothetical protein